MKSWILVAGLVAVVLCAVAAPPVSTNAGPGNTQSLLASAATKYYFHVSTPFFHAHARPDTSMNKKTISDTNAPAPNPVNATANGSRKIVSTSKIRKMIGLPQRQRKITLQMRKSVRLSESAAAKKR